MVNTEMTPTDAEQDAPRATEPTEEEQPGTEQPTPAQMALLLGLLRPARGVTVPRLILQPRRPGRR